LVAKLTDQDLLFFSADHGNDPTDGSTDHTREYVPLLVQARAAAGVDLGIRSQYCDVAATIAEALDLTPPTRGVSFLGEVT
jgi:phosphopentomutase